MLAGCLHCSNWFIMSIFSSLLIVFCWFFTWIVLGDVDLRFSFMLVWKANTVEEETTGTAWLYHQYNQSIHITDGMTVMSLSGSLLQMISVAMDCPCQIRLNWKLLHKFEKWCKFSSKIKAKLCKKEIA